MNEILERLKEPFHPSRITWKPGSIRKDKTSAMALAYADLRAYQDRLDEICGMDWAVTYTPWGDKLICHVTINGVTRSSTGEPTTEAERNEIDGTVAEAQAMKRACAQWGLGRYLYEMPTMWVDWDGSNGRFTEQAKAKLNGMIAQHYDRWLKNRGSAVMVDTKTGEILLSQQEGSGNHLTQRMTNHIAATQKTQQRPAQPVTVKPMEEDANFYPPEDTGIPFGHEDNPFNDPPAPPVVKGDVNPGKLRVLNALGSTFYNKNKNDTAWDEKREELCHSLGIGSSTQLNNAQCDKLIAGIEKRTREVILQSGAFQEGELPIVVAECTAYGDKEGVMSLDEAKGVGLAKVLQEVKRRKVKA
jgi:Rad52/22 family double-strand break repair protein